MMKYAPYSEIINIPKELNEIREKLGAIGYDI